MWCLAHRLELAVKDALKSTAFDAVDDMLLKLYYLYEQELMSAEGACNSGAVQIQITYVFPFW